MVRQSKAAADKEAAERVAAIMALGADATPADADGTPIPVDTTQPIDQRTTDLAPISPAAETAALVAVQAGMRMAETLRRQRLLVFESETWHSLSGDLAEMEAALSNDKPVPPEVISRMRRRIDGWALQRHLNGDGGS
jgi:hypothetical protein